MTVLYKNDPLGTLAPDTTVLLKGLALGSADWADYDGDGDVDLLLTGRDALYNWTSWTVFYENDPVGTLTDTGSHGLPGVSYAPDAAWGDYDNDGDLDLAFLGSTGSSAVGRIYKNDGGGTLTQVAQPLNIFGGCSAWGDYDNDGDLDVAFTGATHPPYVDHTKIYENTGSGFAQAFSFFGLCNSSVSWADVDQDCDLDFLFAGNNHAFEYHAGLYESLGGAPNTAPSAPTGLSCDRTGGGLNLSWSGAADAETPAAGLYYCLRVGTSPGANDVVSGTYGTPLMGNVGQATDLALAVPAGTYYWSVRTIDSGFMASPWSEEKEEADCNANGVPDEWEWDTDGDGVIDDCDNCVSVSNPCQEDFDADGIGDACDADDDNDGLTDADEASYGTDPYSPDTDGDGLLDGTEVDIAEGSGCPDPLNADSDDDTLLDGHQVDVMGTNPCGSDTDGDGIPDDIDPFPTDPGGTSGFIEDASRETAAEIQALDLGLFNGPNNNANKGRRNALANRATDAANAIAVGDIQGAIDSLASLLQKIDGESPPPDWMDDSPEKTALAAEVSLLIALLEYEL